MAVKEHAGKTKFAGVYKIALVDGPGGCGRSAAAAGLMLSIVLVSIWIIAVAVSRGLEETYIFVKRSAPIDLMPIQA